MEDRRREDAGDDDDAEDVDRLGLEEVAYIHLPEDVPADDGGEGKDEEADRKEDDTGLPEGLLEGTLCDLYRDQPRLSISSRQEDDECRSGADEEVNEDLFRYPGPNPFTREQAILMMSDTVEAASRSLQEYTEESISGLVNRLIDGQVADGNFTDCPITFRDITAAKAVLIERLKAMYHTRIQYPQLKA